MLLTNLLSDVLPLPTVQWSAKLNVSVLEADPYSDHVAAVSQSAAGSDCKYSPRSDGIRPVSEVFLLVSFV